MLDILELANGFGAGIDSKLIRDDKENNLFISIYHNPPHIKKGEPATDKKTARKNLVYELLQPLWDNLENKKRKNSTPRVNLAATFPEQRARSRESSSSGSTRIATERSSNSSSGTLGRLQAGMAGIKLGKANLGESGYQSNSAERYVQNLPPQPKPTQSDIAEQKRVPQFPSSNFDHKSTNLTLPTDQSDVCQNNNDITRQPPPVCSICQLPRDNKLENFSRVFESCKHTTLRICRPCAEGHVQMKRAQKSRSPRQCPFCYYIGYALNEEHLAPSYQANVAKVQNSGQLDVKFDPFANPIKSVSTDQSSRLMLSERMSQIPLSAGPSQTGYTPYFRGERRAGDIHEEREKQRAVNGHRNFTLKDIHTK